MPRYDGCEYLSVPQGSAAGDRGYPNVNMALGILAWNQLESTADDPPERIEHLGKYFYISYYIWAAEMTDDL